MSTRQRKELVSPNQQQIVKDAMKAISDAQPYVQALEACGEDCSEYRKRFEYYDQKLRQIHDQFFQG